jgi:hypothetical protein
MSRERNSYTLISSGSFGEFFPGLGHYLFDQESAIDCWQPFLSVVAQDHPKPIESPDAEVMVPTKDYHRRAVAARRAKTKKTRRLNCLSFAFSVLSDGCSLRSDPISPVDRGLIVSLNYGSAL